MSARLPDKVDPWRLASRRASIAGEIGLDLLPRLADALIDTTGEVEYGLQFRMDEQNRPRITGFVRASLLLECQRCLETMTFPVDVGLDLAVIETESEAGLLSDGCEPVVAEAGAIRLSDLVEDELLLALPQIASHRPGRCTAPPLPRQVSAETRKAQDEDEAGRVSPFAELARLKTNHTDEP